MITLNNFTKLDNGQYQMTLFMKNTDSIGDLPSVARPMSPEYFAVTVDYGVPANGSIAIGEDNKVLIYSAGVWKKAKDSDEFKLQELSVEENGKYFPEVGYDGFNKVVVNVQPKIDMPAKGDLINLDNKTYRVLKTSGNIAEVLAMYSSTDVKSFTQNNIYANSSLDVYCNQNFYNSLSTVMQNAIVAKAFQQDEWSYTSGTSGGIGTAIYQGVYGSSQYRVGLVDTAYGESISRKCYILSVQDVLDYLEVTTSMDSANTTLTSENIWKMFWNQTTSPGSGYFWLRSANPGSNGSILAFEVVGKSGHLGDNFVGSLYPVRPAFQIDLSKIKWTKSE